MLREVWLGGESCGHGLRSPHGLDGSHGPDGGGREVIEGSWVMG